MKNQTATKRTMVIRDFDDDYVENDADDYYDDNFNDKSNGNSSNDGDINMSTLNSYLHQTHQRQEPSFDDHDYDRSRSMVSSPEKSLRLMSTSEHSIASSLGQGRNLSFGGEHYPS